MKPATLGDTTTTLLRQLHDFLNQQRYSDALDNFRLLCNHFASFSTTQLNDFLACTHQLAEYELAHPIKVKEKQIYHIYTNVLELFPSCSALTIEMEIAFLQQSGKIYQQHKEYEVGLTNYTKALQLAENNQLPTRTEQLKGLIEQLLIISSADYANQIIQHQLKAENEEDGYQRLQKLLTHADKAIKHSFATQHPQILYESLQPAITRCLEYFNKCLATALSKSLEDFTAIAQLMNALCLQFESHQQWPVALQFYHLLIKYRHSQSKDADRAVIATHIARLNEYSLGKISPPVVAAPALYLQEGRKALLEARNVVEAALGQPSPVVPTLQQTWQSQLLEIISRVGHEVENLLGLPPCPYQLIGLGSLARREPNAYPDIDSILLIQDARFRHHPYFHYWLRLFIAYIRAFAEPRGFHVDIGSKGYFFSGDNNSMMLGAPLQLAEKATQPADSAEIHSLQQTITLFTSAGGETLCAEYQQIIHTLGRKKFALPRHKENALAFSMRHKSEWKEDRGQCVGNTVNLKTVTISPLVNWCVNMALYAGISLTGGLRNTLAELGRQEVIPTSVVEYIQHVLDTLWLWRAKQHLKHHYQHDELQLTPEQQRWLANVTDVLHLLYDSINAISEDNPAVTQMPDISLQQTRAYYWGYLLQEKEDKAEAFCEITGQLLLFQAPLEAHRYYYRKLPDHVRHAALEKARQRWGSINLPWIEEQLVTTLWQAPEPNGHRNYLTAHSKAWRAAVKEIYLSKEDKGSSSKDITVSIGSVTLGKGYTLHQKWVRLLREQGWLLPNGEFIKKERHPIAKLMPGNHLVIPLPNQQNPQVYLKVYPEHPLVELWRNDWQQRLGTFRPREVDLWSWECGGFHYPVLVSEAVIGVELNEVLKNEPQQPLHLHPQAFGEFALLSGFLRSNDNKPDNIITTLLNGQMLLWLIDSDRLLVPSFNHEQILQLKEIAFCMPAMNQELHPVTHEELLSLNPYYVVDSSLQQVEALALQCQAVFGDKLPRYFEEGRPDLERSLLLPPITAPLMRHLIEQLQNLQDLFHKKSRKQSPVTLWEVVACLDNRLANHYKRAQTQAPTTIERFKYVAGHAYSKPETWLSNMTAKKTNSREYFSTQVNFRTFVEDIYGAIPKQVPLITYWNTNLAEAKRLFVQMRVDRGQLDAAREALLTGNLQRFNQLGAYGQELILKDLDFSKVGTPSAEPPHLAINPLQWQRDIIRYLQSQGQGYQSLTFRHCNSLTDEDVRELVEKQAATLISLTIIDCPQMSNALFDTIQRYQPRLKRLSLQRLPKLTSLGAAGGAVFSAQIIDLPDLEKLTINECENLKEVDINARLLKTLEVAHCERLLHLRTASHCLEYVELHLPALPFHKLPEIAVDTLFINHFRSGVEHPIYQLIQVMPAFMAIDWTEESTLVLEGLQQLFSSQLRTVPTQYQQLTYSDRSKILQRFQEYRRNLERILSGLLTPLNSTDGKNWYLHLCIVKALNEPTLVGNRVVINKLLTVLKNYLGKKISFNSMFAISYDTYNSFDIYTVYRAVIDTLGQLTEKGDKVVINGLLAALKKYPYDVILIKILIQLDPDGKENYITLLLNIVNIKDIYEKRFDWTKRIIFDQEEYITGLLNIKGIHDKNFYWAETRLEAAQALVKLGVENETIISTFSPSLPPRLTHMTIDDGSYAHWRWVLGKYFYGHTLSDFKSLSKLVGKQAVIKDLLSYKNPQNMYYRALNGAKEILAHLGELDNIDEQTQLTIVDDLLISLTDDDSEVREVAAAALGRTGQKHNILVMKGLMACLNDLRWNVVVAAVRSLIQLDMGQEESFINYLLTHLLKSNHPEVRLVAAEALGQSGQKENIAVVNGLLALLEERNIAVANRLLAVVEERNIAVVNCLLADLQERKIAVVNPLLADLENAPENEEVILAAIEAVTQLVPWDNTPLLDPWNKVIIIGELLYILETFGEKGYISLPDKMDLKIYIAIIKILVHSGQGINATIFDGSLLTTIKYNGCTEYHLTIVNAVVAYPLGQRENDIVINFLLEFLERSSRNHPEFGFDCGSNFLDASTMLGNLANRLFEWYCVDIRQLISQSKQTADNTTLLTPIWKNQFSSTDQSVDAPTIPQIPVRSPKLRHTKSDSQEN